MRFLPLPEWVETDVTRLLAMKERGGGWQRRRSNRHCADTGIARAVNDDTDDVAVLLSDIHYFYGNTPIVRIKS